MLSSAKTLSVHSPAIPQRLGQAALVPVSLYGHEGINTLFNYTLVLKTPDALKHLSSQTANFHLDDFIGQPLTVFIQLDSFGVDLSAWHRAVAAEDLSAIRPTHRPHAAADYPSGHSDASYAAGAASKRTTSNRTTAAATRPATGSSVAVREISALITHAQILRVENRQAVYQLTLQPWLYLATLTTDCKIYQALSVVDLLDQLLADYPFPVDKRLIETYPQRDYQVQFNETDFAFFSRLCEEWGINYFFEHRDGQHCLILIDNHGAYQRPRHPAYHSLRYDPAQHRVDEATVHTFVPHHQLTSGQFTARDYDYTQPKADLTVSYCDPRATAHADQEIYQWHAQANYSQPQAGTSARSASAERQTKINSAMHDDVTRTPHVSDVPHAVQPSHASHVPHASPASHAAQPHATNKSAAHATDAHDAGNGIRRQ